MEELIENIQNILSDLRVNLNYARQGNKAAARRARKNTLDCEKLFKQYRKESIEAAKK